MEDWKIRLRSAREAAGLNKTQFARAVDVSNPTVTDWEKSTFDGGIQEITGVRLTKICEVLNINPRWLLHGELAGSEQPRQPEPVAALRTADPSAERPARMVLAYDDEEALLDLYRRADPRGKRAIFKLASREGGGTVADKGQA